MKGLPHWVALSPLLFAIACGPTTDPIKSALGGLDLRRCKPARGTTGSPASIEDAVALANGLPFPVTAQCFVESLDRPLRLEATSSDDSVQPAHGERSPRVFVWPTDTLVIALALDGPARDLVEFGEVTAPGRSIKAELEFPLTESVTAADAHQRVRNERHPTITSCFVCHDDEQDEPSVPLGRSSLMLRPHPRTLVDLESLATEREQCAWDREPQRCRYLNALLDPGPIEHRPFDAAQAVF